MNTQRADQAATKSPNDLPLTHQVTDPITGTTAAGPIESEEMQRSGPKGWGTAARWLAFALLLVAFAIVVYWMSGWDTRGT